MLRCSASVNAIGHDNEHIHIAVRSHLASRSRAKKDNFERIDNFDNSLYELINDVRVGLHVSISKKQNSSPMKHSLTGIKSQCKGRFLRGLQNEIIAVRLAGMWLHTSA